MPLQYEDFQVPTSINQQTTSGFGSAAGLIQNAQQGLKDVGSKLSGAIDDLASKLQKEGNALITSGKQALDQLSDFTTVTKFKDNLKQPQAIIKKNPNDFRSKSAAFLSYPADLTEYCITFSFRKYSRAEPTQQFKEQIMSTIMLPIPADLIDRFSANYSSKDLNFFGKVAFDSGIAQWLGQGAPGGGAEASAVGERAAAQVNQNAKNYIAAGIRTAIGDTALGTAADRATGTTLNPFTALQFQGMSLRDHSFKFRFSPNSLNESTMLKKVINEFKVRMLPDTKGLFFDYPDICIISFKTPNTPYSFKTCFLKNMTVNYAPSGVPSFFKGGNFTTEVELSLDFGEIEPVTRSDVLKNDGDLTNGALGVSGIPDLNQITSASPSTRAADIKPTITTPRSQTLSEIATGQTNPLVTNQGMDFTAGNF